jgi:hypothetical protein
VVLVLVLVGAGAFSSLRCGEVRGRCDFWSGLCFFSGKRRRTDAFARRQETGDLDSTHVGGGGFYPVCAWPK